jgi:hypothetical protein
MLEKGGMHDMGESSVAGEREGLREEGKGTRGECKKGGLRKKVSGEGCNTSEFKSTQEGDPLEKERTLSPKGLVHAGGGCAQEEEYKRGGGRWTIGIERVREGR